ncbi:MAG: MotA/TolQ/ExbB proton channel family protein [Enterobacterales bacterium]|nr:MotA/TolQ/ExbB proton channel family protein [Enterobacterales bacterium]
MKNITKLLIAGLVVLGTSVNIYAQEATQISKANSLDELLEIVKKARTAESALNKRRIAEFRSARNNQKRLLDDAIAEEKRVQRRTEQLKAQFDANEQKIAAMEEQLKIKSANLGEMFGVVRQVSLDTSSRLINSIVSAQYPGREQFPDELGARKELPTIKELQGLWVTLQTEMTETGKIETFTGDVIMGDGSRQATEVTRIGAFNLLSDNGYVVYNPEIGAMQELVRQPDAEYTSTVSDYLDAGSGVAQLAVDPSRGSLLRLFTQKMTNTERYHQGGIVGYVITGLLAFGLLIVLERLITLTLLGSAIKKQASDPTPGNNPLGRIMAVYQANQDLDTNDLELKLDEAILKETPKIERGVNIIKVLAAVSPLLGLLGTVTGMIATFQSITLFGTGDPKLMAGGISTALMTTVLGLISAIPLIFLHAIVSGKSKGMVHLLEEQSTGLLAEHAEKGA